MRHRFIRTQVRGLRRSGSDGPAMFRMPEFTMPLRSIIGSRTHRVMWREGAARRANWCRNRRIGHDPL